MNRSLIVALATLLATSQLTLAQVCTHRKDARFLACLKSVDDKCTDLTTGVNRPRKWQSGYQYATGAERVKFALDYQDFLVSKGETGGPEDFSQYRLISYEDRQAWAMQWWAQEDKNFAALAALTEKANWVHDSLVDAGNSIHLACQTVEKLGGDINSKDYTEVKGVDNRKLEEHRNK